MACSGAMDMLDRLIDDDYVQEQLGAGAGRLSAAFRRARTLRAQEAVQDPKLYDQLREAVASLMEAGRRIAGAPEPEPKRRSRRLPALVILAAVAALVRAMHRAQQAGSTAPAGSYRAG